MRILIVSDTHRSNENFSKVIKKESGLDLVIHLGDAEGAEYFLEKEAGCPLDIIAGNNDFFSDLPREREIQLGGYQVLLTHGHNYYVSVGMERIRQEGRERHVDIVMFGHTHRPLVDTPQNDVWLVNPGSLSYPRQDGKRPSYILMDIDTDRTVHMEVKYLP